MRNSISGTTVGDRPLGLGALLDRAADRDRIAGRQLGDELLATAGSSCSTTVAGCRSLTTLPPER